MTIRTAPRREPWRDRAPRLPHVRSGSGSRRSRSSPRTTAARSTRGRPTGRSRSRRISTRPSTSAPRSRPEPTRSTRATASWPRTPRSPTRSSRPGSRGSARRPEALRLGGDKLAAKRIAREAGVPTLPQGSPEEIGFPLVVKAAAGGGGRGMRIVRSAAELDDALAAARREAEGGVRRRHGVLRALSRAPPPRRGAAPRARRRRRPCSASATARSSGATRSWSRSPPPPASIPRAWPRIAAGAVAFAEAIGYRSAGTAEFLVDGADVYFLELNGRIQVEHPVTEEVTGLDIVELQLRVAAGEDDRPRGRAARPRDRGAALRGGSADVPAPGRAPRPARAPGRHPRRRRRRGGRRDRALATTR